MKNASVKSTKCINKREISHPPLPGFRDAIRITWPVMVGYCPMAMAFGVLYGKVVLSFLFGTFLYAGSVQYLVVKLFEDHASLAEIYLSTLFLNLRHVFYGLHFLTRYEKFSFWPKLYSIFGLTDETYAVLVNHREHIPSNDQALVWRVTFLNHLTWLSSGAFGALLSQELHLKIKGLDFFLVGLFLVLLVEQLEKNKYWGSFVLAGLISMAAIWLGGSLWLFWAMGGCVLTGLLMKSEKVKA